MAGAYSQPYQYDQYHQQYPVELIGKAMMYKQEKYDANRAKVQDFLNTFANMDLVKEEDKQHFANNISTLLQAVNASGGGDLSKAGVSDQLIGNLSQAADDTVVNGFVGTQQFRTYQAKWDKIKQDKPDEYNEANYQYGLQNVNSWLNDGKAGTKLSAYKNDWHGAGIGQVTPYVDVIGELQKEVSKIKPDVTVMQTHTGWQFINATHEVVDDAAIKNLVDLKMQDSKFANQVRINTWGSYGQANDEVLKKESSIYLEGKKSDYSNKILSLQNKATTAKDKTAINEEIKYYQNQISKIDGQMLDIPNNFGKLKVNLSSEMYEANLKKQMVDIYAKDNITKIDYATDEQRKAIGEHALREDEIRLKARLDSEVLKSDEANKLAMEALKLNATNPEAARTLNTAFKLMTGAETSILDATIAKQTVMNPADINAVAPPNKVTQLTNDVVSLSTKMKDTGITSIDHATQILMDSDSTPASKRDAEEYIRLSKINSTLGTELLKLKDGFVRQKLHAVTRDGVLVPINKEESIGYDVNGYFKTTEVRDEARRIITRDKIRISATEAGKLIIPTITITNNPEYNAFVEKNSKLVSKLYEGHRVELDSSTGLNYLLDLKAKGAIIPDEISTENVAKYTESLLEKKIRPVIETNANGSVTLKYLNKDGTPTSNKPQDFSYTSLPVEIKKLSQASLTAQVDKERHLEIQFNFQNAATETSGVYTDAAPQKVVSQDGTSVKAYYIYNKDKVSARIELYDPNGKQLEVIPIRSVPAPTENDRYNAVKELNEIVAKKIQDRI